MTREQHDALALQTMLTVTRLHVKVGGAAAGIALERRRRALAAGGALPLSALPPQSPPPSASTPASTSTLHQTAATLAEYTGRITKYAAAEPILQSLEDNSEYAKQVSKSAVNKTIKRHLRKCDSLCFESKSELWDVGYDSPVGTPLRIKAQGGILKSMWLTLLAARRLEDLLETATAAPAQDQGDTKLLEEARAACQQALDAIEAVYFPSANLCVFADL
ncbi:hypothetical protein SCUCBS95973_006038 [Sporothrix curviconia]|uniref:Uncharacterized protein n=1 Tax=Sporothrix curviconia TaxID=1260050 RepID=A0ABP0C437_9PEZI